MEITCQNAGCVGDRMFEFSPGEQDYFDERGLDYPRSCRPCRDWKNAQVDEVIHCSVCEYPRIVSAGLKIMHHKNTGPWVTPTHCRLCERDPDRASRIADMRAGRASFALYAVRTEREREIMRRVTIKTTAAQLDRVIAQKGGVGGKTPVASMQLLDNPGVYRAQPNGIHGNQLSHIMDKHGSGLATSLGVEGVTGIFGYLRELAALPDPNRIAEFRQDAWDSHAGRVDTRVVKYDRVTGVVMIISMKAEGGVHPLVTAFDIREQQTIENVSLRRWYL